jgi:hypothetical protein
MNLWNKEKNTEVVNNQNWENSMANNTNIQNTNINEDIKIEKNEVVKENWENSFDNIDNSDRISKKLKNFLIKKYKK